MIQLSLIPEIVSEQSITNPIETIKTRVLPDLPIVLSYGGGTNSTALLVYALLKGIKIDTILFADTGNEHPRTYDFLAWFNEWLQQPWEFDGKIYPPMTGITITRKLPGNAGKRKKLENELLQDYYRLPRKTLRLFILSVNGWLIKRSLRLDVVGETLGDNCLVKGMLPDKAYGHGSCSKNYKIIPIEQAIKAKYGDQKVIQWVGIHAGETGRLFDKNGNIKPLETELGFVDYPLIKMGLSQPNCEALLRILPRYPGKSSCWFCPNAKVHEVLQLKKEHPELWELGCFMEYQDAQFKPEGSSVKGLGRSFKWADVGEYSENEIFKIDSGKSRCACTD